MVNQISGAPGFGGLVITQIAITGNDGLHACRQAGLDIAYVIPQINTVGRGDGYFVAGGQQRFRVWFEEGDRAGWLGGGRVTDAYGFFSIRVAAPAGSRLRIWSPRDGTYGNTVVVR